LSVSAYTYHFVADCPSASSSNIWTVKIRVDNRIEDPLERARGATLTCNCPGWTRRGEPRTCRHVEQHEGALRRFIAEAERRASSEASAQMEPWLPELRDRYHIPETAPVTVRDHDDHLMLRWPSRASATPIVFVRDAAEMACLRRAVRRPGESRFIAFDSQTWAVAHPLQPRRLPWSPGLSGLRALWASSDGSHWADEVLELGWLDSLNPGLPQVEFGRVPKAIPARRKRFAEHFRDLSLDERCDVVWINEGGQHQEVITGREFAARISLGVSGSFDLPERLARLCGAHLLTPADGAFTGVGDGGCPYDLFDHQINRQPIVGFTLDTASHRILFWTEANPLTGISTRTGWERAAYEASFQNFVHVRLPRQADESLEFYADSENESDFNGNNTVMAMYAVAAEFLLRAAWPGETGVIGFDRPAPFNREAHFYLTLDGLAAEYEPEENGEDSWRLTPQGRLLLEAVVVLEAFAAGRGAPVPASLPCVARHEATVRAMFPEIRAIASLDCLRARREARALLSAVHELLQDDERRAVFGPDGAAILPAATESPLD
jgi:hypothetical protein